MNSSVWWNTKHSQKKRNRNIWILGFGCIYTDETCKPTSSRINSENSSKRMQTATFHLIVYVSFGALQEASAHVPEVLKKNRQQEGGEEDDEETYLPSTAATTLQLISCSYKVLSIRSRRSARRTRFIMKTCVQTNADAHTRTLG